MLPLIIIQKWGVYKAAFVNLLTTPILMIVMIRGQTSPPALQAPLLSGEASLLYRKALLKGELSLKATEGLAVSEVLPCTVPLPALRKRLSALHPHCA